MAALGLVIVPAVACGKKGPPLPPLRIAPVAVTELSARRVGDRVQLRFTLPEKNTDNSTPADLARVEVYALSVEKAADAPQGPDFMRAATRVASVTPKPEERTAAVSEDLDEAARKYFVPDRPAPTLAVAAAAEPVKPLPSRIYLIVPVSRRNHRGTAASASVPLADPPQSPSAPVISYSEKGISLAWLAVEAVKSYNVYEVADEKAPVIAPLTTAPVAAASFDDSRLEFGRQRCYRVTAVRQENRASIESTPSPASCVTPADTFAPAAPTGLAAVAGPGTISLIWDAVAAGDLAGYLVLRGTATGDTLQTLTPEPIKETTYRDDRVTPGETYVYAVIAVDTAKNMSAQSARVAELAR